MFPTDKSTITVTPVGDATYPNLGAKVFLVGNCFRTNAVAMFAQAGCRKAETLEEADLVCFLGGEDVDPRLYGESPHGSTYFNTARDEDEIEVFLKCRALDIPMFGICRGMQLLHVLNGGKLFQNVHGHGRAHFIIDTETKEKLMATSMHHQMCIADGSQLIIAYADNISGTYEGYGNKMTARGGYRELEAAYYPGINAFCVQGHPEVNSFPEYTAWCLRKLERLLSDEPKPQLPAFLNNSILKGL